MVADLLIEAGTKGRSGLWESTTLPEARSIISTAHLSEEKAPQEAKSEAGEEKEASAQRVSDQMRQRARLRERLRLLTVPRRGAATRFISVAGNFISGKRADSKGLGYISLRRKAGGREIAVSFGKDTTFVHFCQI